MDRNEMRKMIEKEFGSRIGLVVNQILMLSMFDQPCDITFYKEPPLIDVKINPQIHYALMYGAGIEKFKEMLEHIKLSNGRTINIMDIWSIYPMPKGGFSEKELQDVDLSKAEEKIGPNGETLRKIIKDTYRCETREDEDNYLRRIIAS